MTYSILLHDAVRNEIGVAIASRYPAVGAVCIHRHFECGIVVTQSMANPWLGRQAIERLRRGDAPRQAIEAGLELDPNRRIRQTHAIDLGGETWAETGADCVNWNGQQFGAGLSLAGNMLTGPEVLDAMADAVSQTSGLPISFRLIRALQAGEQAGGDKRGRQAAAICVLRKWTSHPIDIRVDDHEDPVGQIDRIHAMLTQEGTLDAFDATIPNEAGDIVAHPIVVI